MALSAMKLKKLKAVQVGQSIELRTTDGATYKGVVTEKNEQSIEITGDGFEQIVDYMPDGGEVAGFTLFALTDPLQQKLKALQTGTVVSIVKTTGEMLTGTVADNNGESLDIEGAGFDLVVDYKEIRSVEVGSTVPVTPVNPVPGGVQPAGKPVTAAVPEPFTPFYWQEDLMVPQLSDAELKNLFDDLPADKKNLAQAGYSSFAYNIKNSNPAKARMAAAQLRQTIQQTGRTFDPELNYLCGAMGVRAKLPRSSELMALCNHTPEAAILYYKEENYEEAVEQAVRALESDPLCSEIDALYTVIDDGCLRPLSRYAVPPSGGTEERPAGRERGSGEPPAGAAGRVCRAEDPSAGSGKAAARSACGAAGTGAACRAAPAGAQTARPDGRRSDPGGLDPEPRCCGCGAGRQRGRLQLLL